MRNIYTFIATSVVAFFATASTNAQVADDPNLNRINPPVNRARVNQDVDDLILHNDVGAANSRIEFEAGTAFASTASRIFAVYKPTHAKFSPQAAVSVATRFIDSLNQKQNTETIHELASDERSKWTNLPAPSNAGGIRLGDLNEEQLKSVCELLANLLSLQGYEKIRLIMLADDQLLRNGQPRPGFGSENFSLVIFGVPSATKLWSIQLDGHHVGLNITLQGKGITIAPSFIGTQPVKFKLGGQEVEPLRTEIAAAFLLSNALTEQQFRKALIGQRRGRIVAGPGNDGMLPEKKGLPCSELNEQQKSQLKTLIWAWVGNLPQEKAKQRMIEIESEFDRTYFSWNGSRKTGSDVSYSIFGPSILIEFAYQDLGGTPQNHLHTQYRNPKNDYGKSLEKLAVPKEPK